VTPRPGSPGVPWYSPSGRWPRSKHKKRQAAERLAAKGTDVIETVYCMVIVPTIRGGATIMDDACGEAETAADG
jgi:hypothetical protein